MLLLLLVGAGVQITPSTPIRAYAAISFALNNDGALDITPLNDAEGSVS